MSMEWESGKIPTEAPSEYRGKIGPTMISGQGEMKVTEFGAKRESNDGRGRFDLLPYEAMEAWAQWSEAGANKYGDRNWENGLSVKDCINRMCRHASKAANGWTDEDHLAAVMWNAAAAITMMKRKPECNDHPWNTSTKNTTPTILDDNDIYFLIASLQSGGMTDVEMLMKWLSRRKV